MDAHPGFAPASPGFASARGCFGRQSGEICGSGFVPASLGRALASSTNWVRFCLFASCALNGHTAVRSAVLCEPHRFISLLDLACAVEPWHRIHLA